MLAGWRRGLGVIVMLARPPDGLRLTILGRIAVLAGSVGLEVAEGAIEAGRGVLE